MQQNLGGDLILSELSVIIQQHQLQLRAWVKKETFLIILSHVAKLEEKIFAVVSGTQTSRSKTWKHLQCPLV